MNCVLASCRSTASAFGSPEAAPATAAGNSVVRAVTTFTGVESSTVAMILPAHIARLKVLLSTIAKTSDAIAAESFAATRGK